MYCPGCGKKIPFSADVCPYCHRDNSLAQGYYVLAMIAGLLCGWIGYKVGGGWGAIFGFVIAVITVFAKLGLSLETSPPTCESTNIITPHSPNKDPLQKSKQSEGLQENLISFSYTDATGEHSHRVVEVDRIYEYNGKVYIDGFCRTREDDRTFRADRIVGDIYIPSSAELVVPEDYCLRQGIESDINDDQESYYEKEPTKQYWENNTYVPVRANLKISVPDQNGKAVSRQIQITEYNGSSWLNAFCEDSQQRQTFRIEGISLCIDTETGVVVSDLPLYLLEKYHGSPEYILEQGCEKLSDILMVLYYIGKADGQLRAEERKLLRAVVRKVAVHEQITDNMIDRKINNRQVPSIQAVKLAINRICKASAHNMVTTYKIAKRIVATQKTVHPAETEILEYMQRKMAKEGIHL